MNGLLISFEGTDGCGKSTQIKMLAEYLQDKGIDVVISREPGGSKIGEGIRNILLDASNTSMAPLTELLLYEAARAQHMSEIVFPALEAGKTVILDRFIDSTTAYQGYGRRLDGVEELNRLAVSGRFPDLTVLLELPPEAAFKRKGGNDKGDRMEMSGDDFFERVRAGFTKIAESEPERVKTVNVSGTREETHAKICKLIDRFFEL